MGLTDQDWIGSAVSLTCDEELGVFQGLIKKISADEITIVRAFRNGVPLRKQNAEVVLRCSDIKSINLIELKDVETTTPTAVINKPTPVKLPHFSNILGKQQQLQQQQQQLLQQQQKQQAQLERDHEPPATPGRIKQANGHGSRDGGYAASGVNSALSDKMHQLMLHANKNGTNGMRRTPQSSRASSVQQQQISTTPNSVAAFFGNMIPAKVEVKLGTAAYNSAGSFGGGGVGVSNNHLESYCSSAEGSSGSGDIAGGSGTSSRPIDIIGSSNSNGNSNASGSYYNQTGMSYGNGKRNGNGNGNGSFNNSYAANGNMNGNGTGNGNGKNNKQRSRVRRESSIRQQQHQTFGSEADDPLLQEEFDFEGNLALFDKQAIWDDIESTHHKPDIVRHAVHVQKQERQTEKKYRHDENILASKPLQLRQIESIFDGSNDFVTDDGLIIPTIPAYVRQRIELSAERAGLSIQRQIDLLARGACDLAITLLGGARRLTPANNHQWPKIAIICDGVNTMRTINIGCATGRLLASHGLTVLMYVEQVELIEQNNSSEVALFKATDNTIVHSVDALPTPDLVILSTNAANLSDGIKKWLSVNRASVLAIDPPPCGIKDVAIKYSILPILPLIQDPGTSVAATTTKTTTSEKTSTNNCGKLYLCNLGIPDKFYRDCGIKYKSPYGHKYVIPIHSKD